MSTNFKLKRDSTALLVIDVQERLFPHVEHSCELMQTIMKVVKGFKILKLPIYVTEQYPQGLGATVPNLKACLGEAPTCFVKTAFSCMDDSQIRKTFTQSAQQFVLVGIEAHVCVLQTVAGAHARAQEQPLPA